MWKPDLFDKLKDIFLFERNFILLQPCQIFIFKRAPLMMLLLILNVSNYGVELRMPIRKSSIAFPAN
jgi:hypothetical protein